MNVGMIGLGKLGLPVATAMASRGLTVYGVDPLVGGYPDDLSYEDGFAEAVEAAEGRVRFCGLDEAVANCEVLFLACQTPHEPRFEGVTPLPEDRADFDYSWLRTACVEVNAAAVSEDQTVTLAVISTVLPGTMAREIQPLLTDRVRLVYNPSFIAMGTTITDFLDPEFVLLGGDDGTVEDVYRELWGIDRPRHVRTSVENAELIKVAYNTFIGLKIAFANTLMEVCHKTGTDVDEVTGALKLAHRRLISPAYLDGGMGDGGGCHPRDNIALSWLARELDLSHDLFEDAMVCREDQARWLADLMCEYDVPKGIVGTAYKPGSAIETGSAALLVKSILEDRGHEVLCFDPHTGRDDGAGMAGPVVALVGCRHPDFPEQLDLNQGSVLIDPFRYMPDQPGIEVIRLGEGVRAFPDDGKTRQSRTVSQAAA